MAEIKKAIDEPIVVVAIETRSSAKSYSRGTDFVDAWYEKVHGEVFVCVEYSDTTMNLIPISRVICVQHGVPKER